MSTDHRRLLSEHSVSLSAIVSLGKFPLFVCGMAVTAGLFLHAWAPTDDQPIVIWVSSLLIGGGLLWLFPLLLAYLRSNKKVTVYEEGLAHTKHGRKTFHLWEDIREVYRMDTVAYRFWRQSEMTIVFRKAQTIVLDQTLSEFFQLATLVEAIAVERLLPMYRAALDDDCGAHFGPITLKRDGIRINERAFSWSEIDEYSICNGGLVISRCEDEESAEEYAGFPTVPNYLILLRLLDELYKHPLTESGAINRPLTRLGSPGS